METKLKVLTEDFSKLNIKCIQDVAITDNKIDRIFERNDAYFNLIKSNLIGVRRMNFQFENNTILMRTFSKEGFEAATYYVEHKSNLLKLYHGDITYHQLYSKNSLNIVFADQYYEDEDGVLFYQVVNDFGLDPIGEALTFEEAVSFVEDNKEDYNELLSRHGTDFYRFSLN